MMNYFVSQVCLGISPSTNRGFPFASTHLDAAGMYEGYVCYEEVKTFTENNSPFYRSFLIPYSKQADFATYSLATIHFYIREIIGWRYSESIKENIRIVSESRLTGEDKYSITSWIPLY